MNSRERVHLTLNHFEPDRVPVDLGGSPVTGMHVSTVYKVRQALELDEPGTPVKVIEPFQMLGEIAPDLMDALNIDVVGLAGPRTFFGFENRDWKPWTLFDGTPVLVPGKFNTKPGPDGDILLYPEGDRRVRPSGRMPRNGFYFDAIVRQPPIDDENLNVADNLEEFGPVDEKTLEYFGIESKRFRTETDKAVFANFGGTSFGDIALVPATQLKHPKGIRDIEEWYISTVSRQDYVYKVFEKQCEIALANLEQINNAVGARVSVVFVTGTDFGMQTGPMTPPEVYRKLFQPFHKEVNNWVHTNTPWKTFIHACGSVAALMEDFIEAGFDIVNPVQCSAAGMEPKGLKERYGDRVTFWGGGVDTQKTLPFGTPDEVKNEVRERIEAFAPGGGFVWNAIHNIQARTPVENVLAVFEALKEYGGY